MFILIGAGMFSFTGFNRREGKVLNDKGLIVKEMSAQHTSFNWFPYLGAVLFIAGVVLTTSKNRNKVL